MNAHSKLVAPSVETRHLLKKRAPIDHGLFISFDLNLAQGSTPD